MCIQLMFILGNNPNSLGTWYLKLVRSQFLNLCTHPVVDGCESRFSHHLSETQRNVFVSPNGRYRNVCVTVSKLGVVPRRNRCQNFRNHPSTFDTKSNATQDDGTLEQSTLGLKREPCLGVQPR